MYEDSKSKIKESSLNRTPNKINNNNNHNNNYMNQGIESYKQSALQERDSEFSFFSSKKKNNKNTIGGERNEFNKNKEKFLFFNI